MQLAKGYRGDANAGDISLSLLNHHNGPIQQPFCSKHLAEEQRRASNSIYLNADRHRSRLNVVHRADSLRRHIDPFISQQDYSSSFSQPPQNDAVPEILNHVRQLNEELHVRHVNRNMEDHYKGEWRMVALVLDRLLLITFFVMTVFTGVVIFVNVPHYY